MLTSTYYGYWDYWELYHKVTFDGVNKLIIINPGEYTINVKRDIYSAWKEWILLNSHYNTQFIQALSVIGGEPLSATEKLDATFFLINNWKIKPSPGSYALDIVGNLFTEDSSNILVPADVIQGVSNNISINLRTSAVVRQVTTTISSSSSNYVTASLIDSQASELTNINSTTLSHTQLLNSQSAILNNLQTMLDELYTIHGLKIGFPVNVTTTGRTIINGTLEQDFTTIGTGSLQQTTITRTA